jgi:hypothetical protein
VLAIELENNLAFDLRGSWQVRAIGEAKGQTWMVLLSVLAHTYDHAMLIMMPFVYPDFDGSIPAPHLTTCAKIDKTGAIVADVVDRSGVIKETMIYPTEFALRDDFRRLADHLKLNDADRTELFKCVQRWVVADRRLDPNFDRRDPDAKRLVH